MYKKSLILYITTLFLLLTACNQKKDIPSDDKMIEVYENSEIVFETIKEIVRKYNSFHYPLFNNTDSMEISLSANDKHLLDSLLRELDVQRVFYNKGSIINSQRDNVEISLLYYSWGLSVSGGYKEYIYKPSLKEEIEKYNEMIKLNPSLKKFHIMKIIHKDLNQAVQNYSASSLDLYRPIKGAWFIHLNIDN